MISYTIVSHSDLPDEYATNFLRTLSTSLYDRVSDFKQNPQSIKSLDAQARLVIQDLLANFNGFPNAYGDGEYNPDPKTGSI